MSVDHSRGVPERKCLPVGPKLDPERREEVDELESMTTWSLHVQNGEGTRRDDEEDKGHGKANHLHTLATILLVVDEKGGEMVADQLTTNVDQIVEP